jgi:hypothetical protein
MLVLPHDISTQAVQAECPPSGKPTVYFGFLIQHVMIAWHDNRSSGPIFEKLLQTQYKSGRFLELLRLSGVGQIPGDRDEDGCRCLGRFPREHGSQVRLQAVQKAWSISDTVPARCGLAAEPVRRPKMQVAQMNDRERSADA